MLDIRDLHVGYKNTEVLHGITAQLPSGALTAIIGPNGCGKSTLLKAIVGILSPTSGSLTVDGTPLHSLSRQEAARRISYLPQSKDTPSMTVSQMVLHGRFAHLSYPRRYSTADRRIAHDAMERMGVSAYAETPLNELSGGMRQNAYIAMALSQGGDHILLDEPTTHLDVAHRLQLMQTLRALAAEGKSVVTVLHDLTLAPEYADRILLLDRGTVAAQGAPDELLRSGVLDTVFGVRFTRTATPDGSAYCLSPK